jgi:hypothetical protein
MKQWWNEIGILATAAVVAVSGCSAESAAHGVGKIWRSTYSLHERSTVSETIDANGEVSVRGVGPGVPWPDGSAHVVATWDGTETTLVVIDDEDRELRRVRLDGLVSSIYPCPNSSMVAARHGFSTLGPFEWIIFDVARGTVIERFAADSPAFAWLSATSYLTISKAGEVRQGAIGTQATRQHQLRLPSGREVSLVWVNPQASTIAVRLDLRSSSGVSESDIWLADIDGTSLQRFTATKMATSAAWSPDGETIGFQVDTGAWCAGAHCVGVCELWHAPATARAVRATDRSRDSQRLLELKHGRFKPAACSLTGWTR